MERLSEVSDIAIELINMLSPEQAWTYHAVPFQEKDGALYLFMDVAKLNSDVSMELEMILGRTIRIETLAPLIRSTLGALPYMGEDEFYSLPDPKLQGRAPGDLEFLDPDYDKLSSAEKVNIPLDLEELSLDADQRLKTEQSFFSDSISDLVHADSNGFLEGETKTLFSLARNC